MPTSIFKNFATVVIYLLGFLIALDYLGLSITPLITALGVGGLAVALALQDTLSQPLLRAEHPHDPEDPAGRLRPPGHRARKATSRDITWRNTTIRALENNLVIVPNSKLGAAIVTNTHLPEKEMGLFVPVTVAFDNDLALVERVTIEVAREVLAVPERAVPGFEPVVRFAEQRTGASSSGSSSGSRNSATSTRSSTSSSGGSTSATARRGSSSPSRLSPPGTPKQWGRFPFIYSSSIAWMNK